MHGTTTASKASPAATTRLVLLASFVAALVACGDNDENSAETVPANTSLASSVPSTSPPLVAATVESSQTDEAEEPYVSTSFVVPFKVTLPDWAAAEPVTERPNLVTWEVADPARAVRFFAPARVIRPPDATETEVPEDYAEYLLSLSEFGATFKDVVETTVDGEPATVVTATAANTIDGSFGCEEARAGECWGLIPDVTLRMAVIDTHKGPLLVWQRDPLDAGPIDYASFDAMLGSLHFPEDVVPAAAPASDTTSVATTPPATSVPANEVIPDGTYSRTATREDGEALGLEPALFDAVFGADGELPIEFEIEGDQWRHITTNDAGIREVGDRGTSSYDEDGRWVTVSESIGCPRCVGIFEWTYDSGTLTLFNSEADTLGLDLPDSDRVIGLLVTEGVYQRE
jgi:hypothetical protein